MTIKVPLSALRLPGIYPGAPGEDSKDVTPEVKDPVSFSVEGVVTGINGSMADVEVRLINGERPESTPAEGKDKKPDKTEVPEDMTAEDMEAAAREADEEEYPA